MSSYKKIFITILFVISLVPTTPLSALTFTEVVNLLQAPDINLPTGVTNPKGNIGFILSELFWGTEDGIKNGKIKPQYLDYSGISAWTQSGSQTYLTTTTGSVGIGTTNPIGALDIIRPSTTGLPTVINIGDMGTTVEGALRFVRGTQKKASIETGSDNTYARKSLVFYTNGAADYTSDATERMRINSDGNVGIGTNTPGSKLHLHGTDINQVALMLGNFSSRDVGYEGNLQIGTFVDATWSEKLRVDTNGNVGIGTIAPQTLLNLASTGTLQIGATTDAYYTKLNSNQLIFNRNGISYIDQATVGGSLYMRTSNSSITDTNALSVLSNGNVGIGTVTPISLLNTYKRTTGISAQITLSNDSAINSVNGTALAFDGYYNHALISSYSNPVLGYGGALQFQTYNGSNTLNTGIILDRSGNVGIGTTSPSYKLDVAGDIRLQGVNKMYIGGTGVGDFNTSISNNNGGVAVNGRIFFDNPVIGSHLNLFYNNSSSTAGNIISQQFQTNEGNIATRSVVYSGKEGINNVGGYYKIQTRQDASPYGFLDVFFANSVGNVGIGTTSPATKLDVAGDTTIRGNLTVTGSINGVLTSLINAANVSSGQFGANTGGGNYSFMGNVGIGTTSPGYNLDVQAVAVKVNIKSTTGTNNAYQSFLNGATGGGLLVGIERSTTGGMFLGSTPYAGLIGHQGAYPVQIATNNNVRMTVDSAGNVGIGTTSPATTLDVNGNIRVGNRINSIGDMHFGIDEDNNDADIKYFSFWKNGISTGSELMRIQENGNVGIGTTVPGAKLDILGSSATQTLVVRRGTQGADASMGTTYGKPYLAIGGLEYLTNSLQTIGFGYGTGTSYQPAEIGFLTTDTASYTKGDIVFANRNGTTNVVPTEVMRITSAGNVGIGTASPTTKFYVNGTGQLTNLVLSGKASCSGKLYTDASGNVLCGTDNGITSYTETDPIWNTASGSYYTKINMQTSGQSQLHFNNLTSKPTTIAGYGITDAVTTAMKDATGGYAGLTLFKIDFKNAANTFTSYFTNANTASRTYTFPDRDGTIADNTDLALKAPLASPALTGTPTAPTAAVATNTTQIATTAFVKSQGYLTSYTETDPKVGTNVLNYLPKWNGSALVTSGLFESGANVGIGTASPGTKLDIYGSYSQETIGVEDEFQITRPQNTVWPQMATFSLGRYSQDATGNPYSRLDIKLKSLANGTLTSDTTVMTLQSNGNVGIGTSAPSDLLTLSGAIGPIIGLNGPTTNYRGLKISDSAGAEKWFAGANNLGNYVIRQNNTTDLMTFSGGNVGIGALTTTSDITVNGLTVGKGLGNVVSNTAIGITALHTNTTGGYNTAIGYTSLYSNTTGGWNTAIGHTSLWANTTGGSNTAIGNNALIGNTTGGSNTAVGMSTLDDNTIGGANTAIGWKSLFSNIAGSNGVAIGYNSQYYTNNTATAWTNYNTSVGYESLRGSATAANNTGNSNTAIGYQSLYLNSTGAANTAIGVQALLNNSTGYKNTALGQSSLWYNTTGYNNTAIGYAAGEYIANGTTANQTSNTSVYLGSLTKAGASGNSNEVVIGYDAIGGGSNTVVLGNSSITATYLKGSVYATSYNFTSDRRLKENIRTISGSLDKINKLNGVYFDWKTSGEQDIGFIAQEVEKVEPKLVKTASDEKGLKSVKYANITALLVNAVHEITAKIDALTYKIDDLFAKYFDQQKELERQAKEIELLKQSMQSLQGSVYFMNVLHAK